MKKALLKNSVKEIKNTYKRFISILLMAFLGVGFFAGLRATSPDMLRTIDNYYKEQNVYDIQILSTLGLTSKDVEEISKIENVEKVIKSYETDGKIDIDNKEIITKFITIEDVNKPILLNGNMPQNQDECLVEEAFLTTNNKKIGDTITVDIEDTQNDDGEKIKYLKTNELKIVGTVRSPLFIARDRGTSKLGSGKINYYIYISEDNINASDIYTNIYVTVKDAEKYETSSKEYEDYIEEVKETVYATAGVNIRAKASADADKIGTLAAGGSITRTGKTSSGWSRVDYNGQTGYIKSDYLTTTKPTVTSNTTASSTSSSSSLGQQIADFAVQYVGYPYVYGGNSLTNGVDCSGFTQQVYLHFGYSIPRRASIQATVGTSVAISDLQPGDLVFYGDSEGVGHVVIYIGNGKVVHASTPSKGIIISDLYYRTPMCAKRII